MEADMKKPRPSDITSRILHAGAHSGQWRRHTFDTEARSLEHAVDIIAERQRHARIAEKMKKNKPTLGQELGLAKGRSRQALLRGKISLAGTVNPRKREKFDNLVNKTKSKAAHPYRDLPEDQKPIKVREMYHSDMWGWGVVAYRRLAKLFNIPTGQVAVWIEGV
jgi:hypothetical protein